MSHSKHKRQIRVWFTDFSEGLNPENNYFTNLLREDFDVVCDCDNPEFLFFSVFSHAHKKYPNCVKIFYSGEVTPPDFREADWAFCHNYLASSRSFRLPLFRITAKLETALIKDSAWIERTWKSYESRKFCSMVISNPKCRERNSFFEILNGKAKVESGGRHLNNIGGPVEDKFGFVASFIFNIAFENEIFPGYTTEKITDAMGVGAIPIYWGNRLVHRDFNKASFVDVNDFANFNEAAEYVLDLYQNKGKLYEKLSQPWFENNEVPSHLKNELVRARLREIVNATLYQPRHFVWFKEKISRRVFWKLSSTKREQSP